MKRVLLTGASGFVGSSLARRLLRDGHQVHLLVRPSYNAWRLSEIRENVRIHEIEAFDRSKLTALVGNCSPDWIFHLMAHGAYSHQTDTVQIAQTNLLSTIVFLEACLDVGFEAFVHAGSSSEYGFKDHAPSESEALAPNSVYAVTKAAATLFGQYAARAHDAHVVTVRLYSVFGPWEDPGRLIPRLLVHAMRGELPDLAAPRVARDFVYNDDACDALIRAAATPGQPRGAVYNVGTGVQRCLAEVVDTVRSLFGVSREPRWGTMPNRTWDTESWVGDNSLAHTVLGWNSTTSFEDGLLATARWIRQDSDRAARYGAPAVATGDFRVK